MTSELAVCARGLGKRYRRTSALIDLDLDVEPGEVVGYLGPNGAGKTTTLRLLLGTLRPTTGRAEIFGVDATIRSADAHRRLAYVPGEVSLWPRLTGAETLQFLGRVHGGTDRNYEKDLTERFDLDPSRRVREYSKGNRQKLALISALATRADLLLLDEPTSGLDPLMEQEFRSAVSEARDRGQAILLSSHILSEVEALSDRVAILRSGRLVDQGTMTELRHLSALTVEIEFGARVPDIENLPGVFDVTQDGRTIHCRVQGAIAPLLDLLAHHDVTRLISREPTLEELFLRHYASDPADEIETVPANVRS
jgi:ABC-2 type transport system ATP-binding protein